MAPAVAKPVCDNCKTDKPGAMRGKGMKTTCRWHNRVLMRTTSNELLKVLLCNRCNLSLDKGKYCPVCWEIYPMKANPELKTKPEGISSSLLHRQKPTKWICCTKALCSKWVHIKCDQAKHDQSKKDGTPYICPNCPNLNRDVSEAGSTGRAEESAEGPITPLRPENRLRKCASNGSSTGSNKVDEEEVGKGPKHARTFPYGLRARKVRFVEPLPFPEPEATPSASPPRREIAPLIFLVAVLTSTAEEMEAIKEIYDCSNSEENEQAVKEVMARYLGEKDREMCG